MKNYVTIIIAILLIGCGQKKSYDLVIENVGFFDGEKDHGIVNLGINSDSIAIITVDQIISDSIINGSGKYIIPGLVNSHVHIWDTEQLKSSYKSGILAQIGTHTSNVEGDKSIKEKSKGKDYPYYFTSGIAATVPNGHPTQISRFPIETINDSVSISAWVDNRINQYADFIKIIREDHEFFQFPAMPTLSYSQIQELIDYSHKKGRKAVVHIGTLEEMLTIAEFKPDGFVHMWNYADNSNLTKEKLNILKQSKAFVVPTALLIPRGFEFSKQNGEQTTEWAKENFISTEATKQGIKKMHEHGIMIVAGTDTGAQPFMMDYANDLFAELNLYSESGLSNLEVLKSATGNAARAWNIPVGHLISGTKTNMLLINGNPLENLEALKDIEKIWKN